MLLSVVGGMPARSTRSQVPTVVAGAQYWGAGSATLNSWGGSPPPTAQPAVQT